MKTEKYFMLVHILPKASGDYKLILAEMVESRAKASDSVKNLCINVGMAEGDDFDVLFQ